MVRKGRKYLIKESEKEIIKEVAINASRIFSKYFSGRSFMIFTVNYETFIISFTYKDYLHWTGILSRLNEDLFFDKCIKGMLSTKDILDYQHYDWSTLKRKIHCLNNLQSLLYADPCDTLVVQDFYSKTVIYPLAIKNMCKRLCVCFKGSDLHGRSLRKLSLNAKRERNDLTIMFIYEFDITVGKCTKMIYGKNIKSLVEFKEFPNCFSDDLIQKYLSII